MDHYPPFVAWSCGRYRVRTSSTPFNAATRWELLGSSGCCSLQYCTLDHLHFCTSEIVRVCRRYANFRSRPIARLGVPPRLWRLSWTLGASCLDGQALLPKLMRKGLLQWPQLSGTCWLPVCKSQTLV